LRGWYGLSWVMHARVIKKIPTPIWSGETRSGRVRSTGRRAESICTASRLLKFRLDLARLIIFPTNEHVWEFDQWPENLKSSIKYNLGSSLQSICWDCQYGILLLVTYFCYMPFSIFAVLTLKPTRKADSTS
jgi:hypothetical protein